VIQQSKTKVLEYTDLYKKIYALNYAILGVEDLADQCSWEAMELYFSGELGSFEQKRSTALKILFKSSIAICRLVNQKIIGERGSTDEKAFFSLPFEQRICLHLRYQSKLSKEEVVQLLDSDPGLVDQYLQLGRCALMEKVGNSWRLDG